MLVVMAGLPASGKTTLAEQLAKRLPGVVLNKDRVRAAIFPPELIEYSRAQDDFCMEIIYQTAEYLLRRDPTHCIIIDGRPYTKRYQVERVIQVAQRVSTPFKLIECVVDDETARQRLEQDITHGGHPAANRTFEHYLASKASADPIIIPRLVLITDQYPLPDLIQRALTYIQEVP